MRYFGCDLIRVEA